MPFSQLIGVFHGRSEIFSGSVVEQPAAKEASTIISNRT
jgi:hypothetical protein